MTQRSDSLAQGPAEQANTTSALGTATGHARSTPAHLSSASPSPGTDSTRSATPVKLVWHDPVTGEELTLRLEASRELIDGLKQEGFQTLGSEGDGGSPELGSGDTAAA